MATDDEEDADDSGEVGVNEWYLWNLQRRTNRRWYKLGQQVFYGVIAQAGYADGRPVPKRVLKRAVAAEAKMYEALRTGLFQIRNCDR